MVTPLTHPEFVYKVASAEAMDAAHAAGQFPRMPIDHKDGYIHFSSAEQLRETLRLHFAGQSRLVLLAVRCADLGEGLRWEPSRGGQLFPHHYGQLANRVIALSARIDVAANGNVTLPEWVQ